MAGLLGDADSQANFALAAGLLGGGNFGQAFGRGLVGYQATLNQAADRKMQEAYRQAQMQQMQQQMLQQQAAQAQAEAQRRFLQNLPSPAMGALSGGGGPTMANAAKIDPMQQMLYEGTKAGVVPFQSYLAATQKDTAPKVLKDGERVYSSDYKTVLAENPKAAATPAAIQEYQFAKDQGYQGTFQQFQLEQRSAGAGKTTVSVNTGQKGYENESKLRNDFKTEPIYKDYNDMISAHRQIKAGIAQGTPIGDVATATKIMKLLDPGSVVRESELGVAMAAGGRMDRLQNYVQMQMSGEKLTPQMRIDFGKLADELMAAAGQAYNAKRSEYETMGRRYQLDPSVLGAPYVPPKTLAPKPVGGNDWSITRVPGG